MQEDPTIPLAAEILSYSRYGWGTVFSAMAAYFFWNIGKALANFIPKFCDTLIEKIPTFFDDFNAIAQSVPKLVTATEHLSENVGAVSSKVEIIDSKVNTLLQKVG